jgi:hypothetical protein
MGLFHGEYVENVSLSSIPLMKEFPNFKKQALLNALATGGDIVDALQQASQANISKKIVRMYKEAQEYFPYGLPYSDITQEYRPEVTTGMMAQVLKRVYGNAVLDIISMSLSRLNNDFYMKHIFGDRYGFDPDHLTAPTGVTPPGTIYLPGKPLYWFVRYTRATNGVFLVDYLYGPIGTGNQGQPLYVTRSEIFPSPGGPDVYFYQVEWLDTSFRKRFWVYDPELRTHPELDTITDIDAAPNFGPVIPIKENGVYLNTASALYSASKKLLKLVGLDMDYLAGQIQGSESDGTIYNAYFVLAVDIRSQIPEVRQYLYRFFQKVKSDLVLRDTRNSTVLDSNGSFIPARLTVDIWKNWRYGITIRESNFKFFIWYSHMTADTYVGTIGVVNAVTSTVTAVTDALLPEFIGSGYDQSGDPIGYTIYHRINRSYITFRKQLAPGIVQMVRIHGITANSEIHGKLSDSVTLSHAPEFQLLIPLEADIWGATPHAELEKLSFAGMQLVLHGYQVTYLHWYETSSFGMFIKFVGVVLTIYSLGADGGKFSELAVAIAEYLAVDIVIVNVVLQIAIAFGIGAAGQLVAKAFGAEAGLIFSAIAMTYSLSSMAISPNGLPFADLALAVASAVSQGVQQNLAEAFEALYSESEAFLLSSKDKLEELEKAKSMLYDNKDSINPLFLIAAKSMIYTNESPQDFINRTIHNPNPGVATLAAIRNYVSGQLTLPKPPVVQA